MKWYFEWRKLKDLIPPFHQTLLTKCVLILNNTKRGELDVEYGAFSGIWGTAPFVLLYFSLVQKKNTKVVKNNQTFSSQCLLKISENLFFWFYLTQQPENAVSIFPFTHYKVIRATCHFLNFQNTFVEYFAIRRMRNDTLRYFPFYLTRKTQNFNNDHHHLSGYVNKHV